MQTITVQFPNGAGEMLAGILDRPPGRPRAHALFAHCFTCSKDLKSAGNISQALVAAGYAVLRFDFTGLGSSDGDFADSSFSTNISDLLAAARFLDEEYEAPRLLLGHSLGGTAILRAAHDIPSAVAVATIGSPADPAHVTRLLGDSRAELEARGQAEVTIGGRPFTLRRQFLDDLATHPLPESVGRLRKALLILHAPLDDIVEVENAATLFAAAKHPKSFVSLDGANHLLSRADDSLFAGRMIGAWASRYLPVPAAPAAVEEGVVLAHTSAAGFVTDLQIGQHSLTADEPARVGGEDQGPSPYGLLSAALAACTGMTLRMYADLKKLDLHSISVRVAHDKVHAEDCADCESTSSRVDEFRRVLSFEGPLSADEQQRLLQIADKCPIHRTLHNEVKIRTVLD